MTDEMPHVFKFVGKLSDQYELKHHDPMHAIECIIVVIVYY